MDNIPSRFKTSKTLMESSVGYVKAKLSDINNELMMMNTLWEEVRRYVSPDRNELLDPQVVGDTYKYKRIYDSTAIIASDRLKSALYSYNISPTQKEWFTFQSTDYTLNGFDAVKMWFSLFNQSVMESLLQSNFLLEMQLYLKDLCDYGTACIYAGYDPLENSLSFKSHPIGSYGFECDRNGYPTTTYVKFQKTATNLVEKFGLKNVSEKVAKAYYEEQKKGKPQEFIVWHIVGKRNNHNVISNLRPKTSRDFPYYSIYFEEGSNKIIPMGGYKTNPYIISRFYKSNAENFGRSPAMKCMAEIKDANALRHLLKYATATHIKPPLFVPENGVLDLRKLNLDAGGKNKYNPTMGGDKPFFLQSIGDIPVGWNELKEIQQVIKQTYFWEMFDALGDRRNMTALEVTERIQQQLELFSPTQGRLQVEGFDPLLKRVASLVVKMKGMPPPPQELVEKPNYEIVYNSKLALSIRNIQSAGFIKTMQLSEPLFKMKPETVDNLNVDKIFRDVALNESMPSDWLKPVEQIQQERQARQEQMMQQQKMMQMQEMAKNIPLNKQIEPNSPMAMLQGMAQGQNNE